MLTVVQVPSTPSSSQQGRCCLSHPDWATLVQHLAEQFPEARLTDVVREVRDARQAVTAVALPEAEALDIGEIIARQRLRLATGVVDDAARLDPQPRARA